MAQTAVIAIATTQPTSTSSHVSCPLTAVATTRAYYDSSYNGLALPLEPLTDKERHKIAAILAWDSQYFIGVVEILAVEVIQGTAWVSLSKNRTMPIAVSTLKSMVEVQVPTF